MEILIVSAYYWPEVAGNAPYVTDVAEHLSREHEVTVLTGFAHYPAWRRDPNAGLFATEKRGGVSIRRRWHVVPSARKSASPIGRAVYESSLLVTGAATLVASRARHDVVLGFCPSLADTLIAATAAARARSPYGVVFQDIVSLAAVQSGIAGRGPARVARAVEAHVARRAAAVGFVADGFRSHLRGLGVRDDALVRLRNWVRLPPTSSDRAETRRRLGWREDEFVCLHAGNMGQKQGLDNVIAAARLSDRGIRFVLAGDGGDREHLESLAVGVGNMAFLEPQPSGAYEATLEAADVLLVNQRQSVTDMALASKLTAYFAAGRPIIASVAAGSETAREIERASAGLLIPPGRPDQLADAVATLRGQPALAVGLGENGTRYAAQTLGRAEALSAYDLFVERLASARTRTDRGAQVDFAA
jgi:colanic acid biosynthesis glycosyl transferase WcaI